ncbi:MULTISPECIES: hypothetical protein [Bacteria]|uniref:hypothetical protein n=1 Tax=Bacteria TaxID=2 RepID=UPI003F2FFEDA
MSNILECKSLDDIANQIVELGYPTEKPELKQAMTIVLKEEIEKMLTTQEKIKIREQVEKEFYEEKEQEKIKTLKILIFEVLFLSLIVGLLVNQITDIITYIKTDGFNQYKIVITLGAIILSIGIIYAMVLYKFLVTASNITKNKK